MEVDPTTRGRLRKQLGSRTQRRGGTKMKGARSEQKPRNLLTKLIEKWIQAGRPEVPRRK